jgi:ADP-ribose pyrophosphatase YjhB (NUDIX family)
MNFEPEKFFIGLLDFFSILLPGAVLTFLLMDDVSPVIWKTCAYQPLTGAKGVAVFLVASYSLGHFVFLLGSWLDELYDIVRRHTLNNQITMLSRRDELLLWPVRAAIWLIFKQERNLAVNCARNLKEKQLGALQAKDAVNTFQWCKAWLTENKPKSQAVVQRFEADSKFFRCFVIVLLIMTVIWAVQGRWQLAAMAVFVFLPLALWRYMEQRFKATNQAYWSVITAFAADPSLRGGEQTTPEKATPLVGPPTHAGGVVFRTSKWKRLRKRKVLEFLLTEASDNPKQWVLPKGHVEKGERAGDTAVREVHEETGVWAKIHGKEALGCVSFWPGKTRITVQFFLMEFAGRGLQADAGRKHDWLPLDEAKKRLEKLPETKDMLEKAANRLKSEQEIQLEKEIQSEKKE